MTYDISGFGVQINIRASNTFPQGINITQFADDTDPMDLPEITTLESAMGLNGDLITYSTATPINFTLSVIPASEDDINLGVLFEANRVGRGKTSARDLITLTAVYPDGRMLTLTQGKISTGMVGNSIASAGRQKTKTYGFVFENKVEVNLGA